MSPNNHHEISNIRDILKLQRIQTILRLQYKWCPKSFRLHKSVVLFHHSPQLKDFNNMIHLRTWSSQSMSIQSDISLNQDCSYRTTRCYLSIWVCSRCFRSYQFTNLHSVRSIKLVCIQIHLQTSKLGRDHT